MAEESIQIQLSCSASGARFMDEAEAVHRKHIYRRPEMDHVDHPANPDLGGGEQMLDRMNLSHQYLRDFALPKLKFREGMKILDLGCGGGATIADMRRYAPDAEIDGIDYSEISVAKAQRFNKEAVESGKTRIVRGDVAALPMGDESYDLATAVETVYFWPDMEKAFAEVKRVLRSGGVFAVIDEGSDPDRCDWPDPDGNLHVWRPEELMHFMKKAGFADVTVDHGEDQLILVRGVKM